MGLLLAFSPFLAFLAGEHLLGVVPALCAGCAVAVALVVRGAHETRVLEAGTALLFGALAACAAFVPGIAWSVGLVRLVVDGGLMLLVLGGVACGRPFTLAFARARVTPAQAAAPRFVRLNQQVSAAWAAAFGMLALADLVLVLRPAWPVLIPVAISAAALCAAMKFTQWWPARAAQRA